MMAARSQIPRQHGRMWEAKGNMLKVSRLKILSNRGNEVGGTYFWRTLSAGSVYDEDLCVGKPPLLPRAGRPTE